MRPADESTPRDNAILAAIDGLGFIERRELKIFAAGGVLPKLAVLRKLMACGLVRRVRDGWDLGEGVTAWHISRLALPAPTTAIADSTSGVAEWPEEDTHV